MCIQILSAEIDAIHSMWPVDELARSDIELSSAKAPLQPLPGSIHPQTFVIKLQTLFPRHRRHLQNFIYRYIVVSTELRGSRQLPSWPFPTRWFWAVSITLQLKNLLIFMLTNKVERAQQGLVGSCSLKPKTSDLSETDSVTQCSDYSQKPAALSCRDQRGKERKKVCLFMKSCLSRDNREAIERRTLGENSLLKFRSNLRLRGDFRIKVNVNKISGRWKLMEKRFKLNQLDINPISSELRQMSH